MSPLLRRAIPSPTAVRLFAAASLLGATFLVAPLASADPLAPHHHMRHATSEQRAESVEQRITTLHAALNITPEEEVSWTAVAQVMRDNEARMQGLIVAKAAEPPHSVTAVEDLKTYERFAQTHADGLKALIAAFETLYIAMPDPQKRLADDVFKKFGHRHDAHS